MKTQHTQQVKYLQRGFTLIELLVVVVIISISIGFVIVNISTGTDEELVEEEITRLQQILRFAHEQSVIRTEEYGVRFYETGYRFMRFDEFTDSWVALDKDKLLRSRNIAESIELDLYIEQTPVEIFESQKDEPKIKKQKQSKLTTAASNSQIKKPARKNIIKPHVFLFSSSELSPPFEVRMRIPGTDIEAHLEGLPQGEYKRPQIDE